MYCSWISRFSLGATVLMAVVLCVCVRVCVRVSLEPRHECCCCWWHWHGGVENKSTHSQRSATTWDKLTRDANTKDAAIHSPLPLNCPPPKPRARGAPVKDGHRERVDAAVADGHVDDLHLGHGAHGRLRRRVGDRARVRLGAGLERDDAARRAHGQGGRQRKHADVRAGVDDRVALLEVDLVVGS
jgi:hypothetical protein